MSAREVEELRRRINESWSNAAPGWEKRQAELRQMSAPVSQWLVEAIHPQPGHRVLELAAGPGETGFLAAELIKPGGTLISSDQSEEMVEVARRRAAELQLDNVEFKVLNGEWIDLEVASVDSVLCRWGYMLMADPAAALRETRRVLGPGGRVALAAWDTPDRNLWMAAPVMALVGHGALQPPQPGAPTPFSLADPDRIEALLAEAGFQEIETDKVALEQRFDSFDAFWAVTLDLAAPIADAHAQLDDAAAAAVHDAVAETLAEFVAADGSLAVPASAVVAAASA